MTDDGRPLFSIITPVLNGMPYIRECVESVRAQEVAYEHIVCDGGSTDGTREYLATIDSITFLPGPDNGQGDALVKGFAVASGRYANWINADERLLSGALERIAAAFERHPEAGVVTGDGRYIDAEGHVLSGLDGMPTDAGMIHFRYYLSQPSTWFRLDLFRRIGGLDARLNYCMDPDLYIRLYRAAPVKNIAETWTDFRLHATSKSVSQTNAFYEEWQRHLTILGRPWTGRAHVCYNTPDEPEEKVTAFLREKAEEPELDDVTESWIRSWLLFKIGREEEGISHLRRVVAEAVSVPMRLDAVRELMRRAWRGRRQEEMRQLHATAHVLARGEESIEDPEREMLWADYHLASLAEVLGDRTEARRLFERIRELDEAPSCLYRGGAEFHLARLSRE